MIEFWTREVFLFQLDTIESRALAAHFGKLLDDPFRAKRPPTFTSPDF